MSAPVLHPIVTIMNGEAVADSRDVAAAFDRQHRHVRDSIIDLVHRRPDLSPCFRQMVYKVDIGSGAQRDSQYYMMNRKGFVVLVAGFKGDKALAFRIAFYDAFEQMEQSLREMLAEEQAAALPSPPADLIDVREKLLFVREARALGGKPAGRKAWMIAGLPDVFSAPVEAAGPEPDGPFSHWLHERTEASGGSAQASVLYQDYVRWCEEGGLRTLSMKGFARQLQARGHVQHKSSVIQYRGLRLREGVSA